MNYATKTMGGAVARQPDDLATAFKEARAAGDTELADAIKAFVNLARLEPSTARGETTLALPSGRRVPLREVRAHIRRGGRAHSAPARPGSLLDTMQKISARCRALRGAIDREKIATVLSNTTGRARKSARPVCDHCREPIDSFNECGCD